MGFRYLLLLNHFRIQDQKEEEEEERKKEGEEEEEDGQYPGGINAAIIFSHSHPRRRGDIFFDLHDGGCHSFLSHSRVFSYPSGHAPIPTDLGRSLRVKNKWSDGLD